VFPPDPNWPTALYQLAAPHRKKCSPRHHRQEWRRSKISVPGMQGDFLVSTMTEKYFIIKIEDEPETIWQRTDKEIALGIEVGTGNLCQKITEGARPRVTVFPGNLDSNPLSRELFFRVENPK
jgi:hypothetical protein